MALPPTVRVKLSSEAAGLISITPVVVQEMPLRELVEHMLGVIGKDEARVLDLLVRGTMVSGASRFRWTGWEADAAAVRDLLASFPDPDPSVPFAASRCSRAVLRAFGGRQIELPREAALRRGLFRRASFWDVLMEVAGAGAPRYVGYSYRDRADWFSLEVALPALERLRSAAKLVRYTTLRDLIGTANLEAIDLYVTRSGAS